MWYGFASKPRNCTKSQTRQVLADQHSQAGIRGWLLIQLSVLFLLSRSPFSLSGEGPVESVLSYIHTRNKVVQHGKHTWVLCDRNTTLGSWFSPSFDSNLDDDWTQRSLFKETFNCILEAEEVFAMKLRQSNRKNADCTLEVAAERKALLIEVQQPWWPADMPQKKWQEKALPRSHPKQQLKWYRKRKEGKKDLRKSSSEWSMKKTGDRWCAVLSESGEGLKLNPYKSNLRKVHFSLIFSLSSTVL